MSEVYAVWLDPKWRSCTEPNFCKFISVFKNNLSGNKSKRKERREERKKEGWKQGRREGEERGNRYCTVISTADTLFMVSGFHLQTDSLFTCHQFSPLLSPGKHTIICQQGRSELWLAQNNANPCMSLPSWSLCSVRECLLFSHIPMCYWHSACHKVCPIYIFFTELVIKNFTISMETQKTPSSSAVLRRGGKATGGISLTSDYIIGLQ